MRLYKGIVKLVKDGTDFEAAAVRKAFWRVEEVLENLKREDPAVGELLQGLDPNLPARLILWFILNVDSPTGDRLLASVREELREELRREREEEKKQSPSEQVPA